jgi:quercetin dioxygenase-like cupin family protein
MTRTPNDPPYVFHADLVHRFTPVPAGQIVSELLHHDDHVKVTLFGCADGEQLSDQIASKSFILQVLAGEARFVLDGDDVLAGPGSWMRMAPGEHQPITAVGEATLLLTLLKD